MRPRNTSAREQLLSHLRRGPVRIAPLAGALGVSPRSLLRMLDELGPALCVAGDTSRRRYALRRPLRTDAAPLPLFGLDADGRVGELGSLALLQPGGSWLDLQPLGWPVPDAARDGWWPGLPYPLHDMAPRGYLGRAFARQAQQGLEVAPDPREWGDDALSYVLSRRGADLPGHFILGEASLRQFQALLAAPPPVLTAREIPKAYAERADAVARDADAPTGAGLGAVAGEFPKFGALRELPGARTPHVVVKFSGPDSGSATQRWADLLVCEHLALGHAASMPGVSAPRSRIGLAGGRTFLEVERFDRQGLSGRLPRVSLAALAEALLGSASHDWSALAGELQLRGLLDAGQQAVVERLWWYGRLIGDTDTHPGHLSFVPGPGGLRVAPVHGMLPMAYAPLPGGEVRSSVAWQPVLPPPRQAGVWRDACGAALAFWREVGSLGSMGTALRAAAARHQRQLHELAERL